MKTRDPHIPMKRLQRADKVLGLLACGLLQPWRWARSFARPARSAHSVLLIKFWGIGSLQLLTPAVRALRQRHPGARFTLLTLRENEPFARGLATFDDVWTLDVGTGGGVRGWSKIFARIVALARRLRRARFDRVYDFEFFTRFSGLVSLVTGAPETTGFASPRVWRGGFHTHTTLFNRYWHVARNFRALAGGEDGTEIAPGELQPYRFDAHDEQGVQRKLEAAGLSTRRPFVVLNPNAGKLSLERRWPAAAFAELARRLVLEDGLSVILIGAPSETEYVRSIAADVGAVPTGHVEDFSGKLSIGELCALLSHSSALVTNDSGPMHLGAALGTTTIGLFGPETPVMYRPLGERARALYKPTVCSPCINVHDNKVANCIHGRPECLVNISVDEVLEETRASLWDGMLVPAVLWPRQGALRVLKGGEALVREQANG